MRAARVAAVFAFAAVPVLARAHDAAADRDAPHDLDRCAVHGTGGDRVVREGDLVVEQGDRAKDVVALQGDVIVRAGATVDDAFAIGGDVVVERGALVRGSAVSVNGDVRVAEEARVDGDVLSLGGKVRVSRGAFVAGHTGTLSATWNGTALAAAIASGVAEKVTCADLAREVE